MKDTQIHMIVCKVNFKEMDYEYPSPPPSFSYAFHMNVFENLTDF